MKQVQGLPVTEYIEGPVTHALQGMWSWVRDLILSDGAGM